MKYIFANWKMYLDFDEAHALAMNLSKNISKTENIDVAIFPSTLSLADVREQTKDTSIKAGAQNISWVPMGAYTGAVSALMCKRIGCEYALVGHSERRYIFGEKNEDVRKKVEACLEVGLTPVVCIGETAEDKAENKRQYRLKKQLLAVFEGFELNGRPIIIAYEPIWAISGNPGSEPCSPADAADVHGWIKQELKTFTDQTIPVLYGGSVNSENVVSYVSIADVDGVLVGSASTKEQEFLSIIGQVNASIV